MARGSCLIAQGRNRASLLAMRHEPRDMNDGKSIDEVIPYEFMLSEIMIRCLNWRGVHIQIMHNHISWGVEEVPISIKKCANNTHRSTSTAYPKYGSTNIVSSGCTCPHHGSQTHNRFVCMQIMDQQLTFISLFHCVVKNAMLDAQASWEVI